MGGFLTISLLGAGGGGGGFLTTISGYGEDELLAPIGTKRAFPENMKSI